MKRINLARAIYQDADIYLFDDVLASLDIKVATHIFEECFLKFIKGKSILYISSSYNHVKNCDRILTI